jgi:hypothetical protein
MGLIATGLVLGALIVSMRQPRSDVVLPAHFVVPLSSATPLGGLDFPSAGDLARRIAGRLRRKPRRPDTPVPAVSELHRSGADRGDDELPSVPSSRRTVRWVAFFADGQLKKVNLEGGAPVTVCEAPVGLGGSWGPAMSSPSQRAPVQGCHVCPPAEAHRSASRCSTSRRENSATAGRNGCPTVKRSCSPSARRGAGATRKSWLSPSRPESGRRSSAGGTIPTTCRTAHCSTRRTVASCASHWMLRASRSAGLPVAVLENVRQSADGAAQLSVARSGAAVFHCRGSRRIRAAPRVRGSGRCQYPICRPAWCVRLSESVTGWAEADRRHGSAHTRPLALRRDIGRDYTSHLRFGRHLPNLDS